MIKLKRGYNGPNTPYLPEGEYEIGKQNKPPAPPLRGIMTQKLADYLVSDMQWDIALPDKLPGPNVVAPPGASSDETPEPKRKRKSSTDEKPAAKG